jgi:tRNA(Ile)-lysidine synthase
MSLYSDVLKTIRRRRLFSGVETVVVGLSGGADSVCLLDLLALMRERGDVDVGIHAAHLNHALRGEESDEDERSARELAGKLGLPITVDRRDIGGVRAEEGGSLEAVARRERYAFLGSVAESVGAGAVAVGHHADDQIETVLHRLIRGAGLKGLRGIPLSRLIDDGSAVRLVRPLLFARRAEILDHLRERGLTYREDSSNADAALTRNKLRHELLPRIESDLNPAFGESLLRLSRSATDVYELLLDVAHTAAVDCVSGDTIDLAEFGLAHGAVRPLLIDLAVEWVDPLHPQFDATHYDAIVELALNGAPDARLDLPGGIVASRSRDAVSFGKTHADEPAPAVHVTLACPGETVEPLTGARVDAELCARSEFDFDAFLAAKTCYDEAVDADAAGGALVLRSWQEGDRFEPLGAGGGKKIGDFLTDVKAPAAARGRVMLVTADGRPVWLVGHRIDERAKITNRTERVLRLSVKMGEQE